MVMVTVMNDTEISVHWTGLGSEGANGYVIVYDDGTINNTAIVKGGNISQETISNLNKEHYTIRMVAYLELPSILSVPVEVWLNSGLIILFRLVCYCIYSHYFQIKLVISLFTISPSRLTLYHGVHQ